MTEESMFRYTLQRIWLATNLVSSLLQELTEAMAKTRRNPAFAETGYGYKRAEEYALSAANSGG